MVPRYDALIRALYGVIVAMLIVIGVEVYEFSDMRPTIHGLQDYETHISFENQERILNFKMEIIEDLLEESYRTIDELEKAEHANPVRCLTDNIYYESGFEPYEGQLAVAQVTLNRANNQKDQICSVVYYKKVNPRTGKKEAAFSWTLGKKWKPHGINYRKYQECLKLARAVLTKKVRSDIIDSSVKFYHASYIQLPLWASEHEEVATIGNHIFYR